MNLKEEAKDIIEEKNKKIDKLYQKGRIRELQKKQEHVRELQKRAGKKLRELSKNFILLLNVVMEKGEEIYNNIIVKDEKVINKKTNVEINLKSIINKDYILQNLINSCRKDYKDKFSNFVKELDSAMDRIDLIDKKRGTEITLEVKEDKTLTYCLREGGFCTNSRCSLSNRISLNTYDEEGVIELIENREYIGKALSKLESRFEEFIEDMENLMRIMEEEFMEDMVLEKV